MKNRVRMQLHAAILAAVAFTTIFTGCSGNTASGSEAIGGNTSYVTEIPDTPDTSDVIDIGTNDSDAFSIKYKYWYDNLCLQNSLNC